MRRVFQRRLVLAVGSLTLAGICSLDGAAQPQPSRDKSETRRGIIGWDGKTVTRACRATVTDLIAFKATLIEHEKARIGFKNKIRLGVISGGELSGGRIKTATPTLLLQKITQHLAELEKSGRTAALVYDIGLSAGEYALCVWLITANGVEAAATVPIPTQSTFRRYSAAAAVRSGLDIEGRAAARSPRLRTGATIEGSPPSADGDRVRLRDEAWQLLMPAAIAARLQASDAQRLLILPVSDIGFAPFAALPIGERLLIDRFALVLLPDVEALLGLSAAGQRWESEIRMRSIVVGDPDLSGDPQWEFPPLAGARSEALEVAALFGQQPLLGQQATRTHVLDQLKRRSDAKLIYLATHAMSDAVNPMDGSFLGLAEDHLYGRDIKGLIFSNNPLVVMSACQTGLGKVFEGGTFGLVRAWYHVGSPQIVMSLWNIDDDATKDMMVEFMRRLKAGELTEFALQRAMLTTRARYRDPALWASVALFGLPSRRPETREAPRSGARPTNLTERAAATVGPAIGEAQRVVLHEENPDDRSLQRFAGSVIWRIEKMPSADGQAPELAVRADVTIPERNITMTWTLRRNTDLTLPASHVVTTSFAIPAEFQRGGVQNVPGILMKSSEEARGVQLAGLAVKIPGGSFLLGLSALDADVLSNVQLLKEGTWLDIPIIFHDGRRAILAVEKGAAGTEAFNESFAVWSVKR